MPIFRPRNVSTPDGYTAYLEELDVLLSPEAFVDHVLNQLHHCNWIYWNHLEKVKQLNPQAFATHVLREVKVDYPRYMRYLNDAELIDPAGYAEYVLFETEACYAIHMADVRQQQFQLSVQIQQDEEKAEHYLSEIHLQNMDYEDSIATQTAMEIYEFFGPEDDDELFRAETAADLDRILDSIPHYVKSRCQVAKRRKSTVQYKHSLRVKALTAQKNFARRSDNDAKFTGNCAGFIIRRPHLATSKATGIWKLAKKMKLVEGDIF